MLIVDGRLDYSFTAIRKELYDSRKIIKKNERAIKISQITGTEKQLDE